jgi:hypothetical protein
MVKVRPQRLEQVMLGPVDQGHLHRCPPQPSGREQAGENPPPTITTRRESDVAAMAHPDLSLPRTVFGP